jgi:hypothetical protein
MQLRSMSLDRLIGLWAEVEAALKIRLADANLTRTETAFRFWHLRRNRPSRPVGPKARRLSGRLQLSPDRDRLPPKERH